MLLAGMALPPIQLGGMGIVAVAAHIGLLTIAQWLIGFAPDKLQARSMGLSSRLYGRL